MQFLLTDAVDMGKIASDLHFLLLISRKMLLGGNVKKTYHSKNKDLILSYASEHKSRRFSAQELYQFLQEHGSQMNLTTVYRNLDKLTEHKSLIKFKTAEDGCTLFQYVEPHGNCHEHLHMQCRSCGKIIHLECQLMKEITEHLSEHHGFRLECTGSVLLGLCDECRN